MTLSIIVGIIQVWNIGGRIKEVPFFQFNRYLFRLLTIRFGFLLLGKKVYDIELSWLFMLIVLNFFLR